MNFEHFNFKSKTLKTKKYFKKNIIFKIKNKEYSNFQYYADLNPFLNETLFYNKINTNGFFNNKYLVYFFLIIIFLIFIFFTFEFFYFYQQNINETARFNYNIDKLLQSVIDVFLNESTHSKNNTSNTISLQLIDVLIN
jgi:ATP-dependent Zn protease